MPRFDADVLTASADIDAVFAEDFVLRPYASAADKRAAPAPDPTRDTIKICGVFVDKAADPREPNAYDVREHLRPGVASGVLHIEFSPAAMAPFASFDVRDGDHIDRCATDTAYIAKTSFVTPNGIVRVPVNRLGK